MLLLDGGALLRGGGGRRAPLPFDEALREKVFFDYQVLFQTARTRGAPRRLAPISFVVLVRT